MSYELYQQKRLQYNIDQQQRANELRCQLGEDSKTSKRK